MKPAQPPIQWVPGALSLGVKRPGRGADHLLPSSAEVNEWSYTSTPPYAFMTWCTGTTLPFIFHPIYIFKQFELLCCFC